MRRLAGILIVIFGAAAAAPAAAPSPAAPDVVSAHVRAEDGWLCADILLRDLIDLRTASTIDSGLSGVCAYEIAVLGPGVAPIGRRTWTVRLEHDLWEDVYVVDGPDGRRSLGSLAAMDSLCSRLDGVRLVALERLDPETEYRLEVTVEVLPLATEDQDRLSRYLSRRGGGTREEGDLDLGSLFGRLFKGGAAGRATVAWTGPAFRPRSLEVRR